MTAKIYNFLQEKENRKNPNSPFKNKTIFYSKVMGESIEIKEEDNYNEKELEEINKGNFFRPNGVFK